MVDELVSYAFSLPLGFHSFTSSLAEVSVSMIENVNSSLGAQFVKTYSFLFNNTLRRFIHSVYPQKKL